MSEPFISKKDEMKNTKEERYFEKVIKHLYNTVFKFSKDASGECIFTLSEGRIAEKMGMTTTALHDKSVKEVFPEDVATLIHKTCEEAFKGSNHSFEIKLDEYYFLVYLSPIIENNQIIEVVGTAIDITDRKLAEEKIKNLAFHDSLTELPNRRLLEQHVNELIKESNSSSFGILFLDINRFKYINDTFGHSFGDKLLITISNRIKNMFKKDVIYRQGGDEFIILLPKMNRREIKETAEQIIAVMQNSLSIDNEEIITTVSIGGALYPDDGDSVEILLKHADAAMYYAKRRGDNKFQFFSKNLNINSRNKFKMEKDLRKAIKYNQFELFYQPQVNIDSGEIVGVEALLRWKHPDLGYISPNKFIPVAEETELIVPIGHWVLETACQQHMNWLDKGFSVDRMSVNVSQLQFNQPDFVKSVQEILFRCNLSGGSLEFEITESVMADFPQAERVIHQLNELGIKISIDDFGTGYSSLSYLSRLPIHKLKIDQSFLSPLNKSNKAIIKSIIGLADNLQLEIVAEGVETKEHVAFLSEQNCKLVQGYYFSKPLPVEKEEELFMKQKS